MNRRTRILGLFLLACFGLLVAQLANFQVRQATALQHSPYYHPPTGDVFAGDRGEIISADGFVLARSVPTKDGFGYQRVYPQGTLFADITGYVNVVNSNISTGLEAEYGNPVGETPESQYLLVHDYPVHGLRGYLSQRKGTDSITITVPRSLQLVAKNALGPYQGALVAWDPRNGDILAMYSNPTYDPNALASHNSTAVARYFKSLDPNSASSPLVNGATQVSQHPGSTFKIITTSAIYDHKPSIATQYFKPVSGIALPNTTSVLHNYASEVCGGNLAQIFARSCDTAYGKVGLELGPKPLAAEADAFGLNEAPPIDLPGADPGFFPPAASFSSADPFLAYSAIGQYDDRETPLGDAMVAGAIADGGRMMTPHLLSRVIDDEGDVVDAYRPHFWRRATSASTAAKVLDLMRGVTTLPYGTATGVFPADLHVAAKTGTAEVGLSGCSADWLVATAPAGPGDTPTVAVAGYLPYQSGLSCSETGAEAAGPRVAALLEATLAYQGSQRS